MKMYVDRELEQGAHLVRALESRYQKTFSRPLREIRRLGRGRVRLLIAHNPYSRCRWFRAVARRLGRVLGAAPPRYRLGRALYLVTILDRGQVIDPDLDDWDDEDDPGAPVERNPTWGQIRSAYRSHLWEFDYFGMLDCAMFVSARRAFRATRIVHVHLHALVWNASVAALEAAKQRALRNTRPLVHYTQVFDYRRVEDDDFLQLVWYVNKTPRKQYQIHVLPTGRWREYKRGINGVNSVRLYHLMRRITLNDLALAGGRGVEVLRRVQRDVQRG